MRFQVKHENTDLVLWFYGQGSQTAVPSGSSSSAVKNPPAMQETQEKQVRSLGQEDPLKKGMATHFSVLAWRIPGTEEPGGLQSMGSQESDTTYQLSMQGNSSST